MITLKGVTSIGIGAFFGCSSLTEITLPDSVRSIHREAFDCCSSLARIDISDPNKNIFEGRSLLQFALEEEKSNSILAINTLLKHGDNILVKSLPADLQTSLFRGSRVEDKIDSIKVLRDLLSNHDFVHQLAEQCCQSKNSHILDSLIDSKNSDILLALFSSNNKEAIDNLVRRYIDKGKLHVLNKLIDNNKNARHEERRDRSSLEQVIKIRSKKYRILTSNTNSRTLGIPLDSLQSYLDSKDAKALYLTFPREETRTLKASAERQSSSSVKGPSQPK